jgi:hypothetical protein
MSNHLFCHENRNMLAAIVDRDRVTNHPREDRARTSPGADHASLAPSVEHLDLLLQLGVDVRPLL